MSKTRLFGKSFQIMAFLIACMCSAAVSAQLALYQEGKHYTIVNGSAKPKPGKNVEVLEIFWYGCGHCFKFESVIKPWKKTKASYIDFKRAPAMWKQRQPGVPSDLMWTHAKLFYAAAATDDFDKLHSSFFDGMHKYSKRLFKTQEIQDWVTGQNVNGPNFVKMMDSFAIKSQVEQADKIQRKYKITGTPEVIVGGHYHVTAGKAGSQKAMLEIASYLAEKIYKGQ